MDLKIAIHIRQATMDDFIFQKEVALWEKRTEKKVGMPYFLRNSKGNLESYKVTENTKAIELKPFLDEGRCFVLQEQMPGEGKMIEILT